MTISGSVILTNTRTTKTLLTSVGPPTSSPITVTSYLQTNHVPVPVPSTSSSPTPGPTTPNPCEKLIGFPHLLARGVNTLAERVAGETTFVHDGCTITADIKALRPRNTAESSSSSTGNLAIGNAPPSPSMIYTEPYNHGPPPHCVDSYEFGFGIAPAGVDEDVDFNVSQSIPVKLEHGVLYRTDNGRPFLVDEVSEIDEINLSYETYPEARDHFSDTPWSYRAGGEYIAFGDTPVFWNCFDDFSIFGLGDAPKDTDKLVPKTDKSIWKSALGNVTDPSSNCRQVQIVPIDNAEYCKLNVSSVVMPSGVRISAVKVTPNSVSTSRSAVFLNGTQVTPPSFAMAPLSTAPASAPKTALTATHTNAAYLPLRSPEYSTAVPKSKQNWTDAFYIFTRLTYKERYLQPTDGVSIP